jgi:hypothetical protein
MDENYPIGTRALSSIGTCWIKVAAHRWQAVGGAVFPRPGADAVRFVPPADQPPTDNAPCGT